MNQSDNISAILYGKGDMRIEPTKLPSKPGENEIIVAIHSVGICGSDVHYLTEGRIGHFILTSPMILGHETSGTVVQIGKGVKHLAPGDRIALEVGIPCRLCDYCKSGRYNLCPDIKFCATPPYNGTLTRFYLATADFCYKLPDNVSYEEGAMLEPLSVAVSGCKRGKLAFGEKVLVLGAGPVGLLTMMVAKALGAGAVCITDVNESRVNFAKKMGADYTVSVGKRSETELSQHIEKLLGDQPVLTIDCCGFESSIKLGIKVTKTGGRFVLIGHGEEEVTIPLIDACIREIDIIGNFRYCNCYPLALSLISSGKVDVKPLITHHYKLEESKEAFEVSRTCRDNAIKVMIKCAKD